MKVNLAIPLLLFISIYSYAQSRGNIYTINDNEIVVCFTSTLIIDDLVEIKQKLKEKNVDLTYTLLQFDNNGFLQKISASIDYGNGIEGSFDSMILQPGDAPGFRHKFLKNGKDHTN